MAEPPERVFEYAGAEARGAELRTVLIAAVAGAVSMTAALAGLTKRVEDPVWGVAWVVAGMAALLQLWAARDGRRGRTAVERGLVTMAGVMLLCGSVAGGVAAGRIRVRMGCAYPTWMICETDSRRLLTALTAYTREHGGRYPGELPELVTGPRPYLDPQALARLGEIAPPLAGATARPASGPVAYWYLGGGESEGSPPGTVLFVEQGWRHGGGSIHVLTAGGLSLKLQGTDATAVMRQVLQGTRPVTWPVAKMTTTRAASGPAAGGSVGAGR